MSTPESSLLAVLTTVAKRDDARRLARQVVRAGLAACAQLEPIESIYVWKGSWWKSRRSGSPSRPPSNTGRH